MKLQIQPKSNLSLKVNIHWSGNFVMIPISNESYLYSEDLQDIKIAAYIQNTFPSFVKTLHLYKDRNVECVMLTLDYNNLVINFQ